MYVSKKVLDSISHTKFIKRKEKEKKREECKHCVYALQEGSLQDGSLHKCGWSN